jgi:hypothetical protein
MAGAEKGFGDVVYDLVSVEYHALKGGYVYGQYVRDAENEGQQEIAEFFRQVTREDAARAEKCHRLLLEPSGAKAGSTAPAHRSRTGPAQLIATGQAPTGSVAAALEGE